MSALLLRRPIRIAALTLALSALPLALTACASANPVPVDSSSATASPSPTTDPSPSESPAPNATDALNKTSDDIHSPVALYELKGGSNFSLDPSLKPASGSTAAKIVSLQGISCSYVNETSGETFTVSVAQVTTESAAALKAQIANEFGKSALVASYSPTSTIQGYFRVLNGVGEAQVGTSNFWISIASKTFETPGDVEQLVQTVEDSLGRL